MRDTILYEKVGDEFVPVRYWNETINSFPKGEHLVIAGDNAIIRTYNIDPGYVELIAAGKHFHSHLVDELIEAGSHKLNNFELTEEQEEAWANLNRLLNQDAALQIESYSTIADKAVSKLESKLKPYLNNPAVKQAYNNYIMVLRLAFDKNNE